MVDLTNVFSFFRDLMNCIPAAFIRLVYVLGIFSFYLYLSGKFGGDHG